MLKRIAALIAAATLAPVPAAALCSPPAASIATPEVARSILDGTDVVGIAVLEDGHVEGEHDPQRLRFVELYKGTQERVVLPGDRLDGSRNTFLFDESKFVFLHGQSGDLRFVALKMDGDKAYFPACTALAIRSRPLAELISAMKAMPR